MNILLSNKFFNLTVILILSIFVATGCNQQSSIPENDKIKALQDEVITLKIENEKLNNEFAKQRNEIELIKQRLVPSYMPQLEETDEMINNEGDNTARDTVINETTVKTTTEKTVEEIKVNNNSPSSSNATGTSGSKLPMKPQSKSLPQEASKPSTNNTNDETNLQKQAKIKGTKEPHPQSINDSLPSTRTVPHRRINVPSNPEPVAPASSSAQRNIVYSFSDIMNHPFKQYIGILTTIGGIFDNNSGYFHPEETITKAEYLTWLFKTYKAYHKNVRTIAPGSVKVNVFDDVPQNHPAYPYIQALAEYNLLKDFTKERVLHPDDPLTREELIAFTEYLQRQEPDFKLAQITPGTCNLYIDSFFSDGKTVNIDYSQMIYRNLNESDLINKTFKVFNEKIYMLVPKRAVTRAQAAASLCFLDNMKPSKLGFLVKEDLDIKKKTKFSSLI